MTTRVLPTLRGSLSTMILLSVLGVCLPDPVLGQDSSSGSRGWHKWAERQRTAYVLGFAQGFYEAHLRLCTDIELKETSGQRTASAFTDCEEAHGHPFNSREAVDAVTTFYSTYSDSQDVEVREIVEGLLRGATIEQIHKGTQQIVRHAK